MPSRGFLFGAATLLRAEQVAYICTAGEKKELPVDITMQTGIYPGGKERPMQKRYSNVVYCIRPLEDTQSI